MAEASFDSLRVGKTREELFYKLVCPTDSVIYLYFLTYFIRLYFTTSSKCLAIAGTLCHQSRFLQASLYEHRFFMIRSKCTLVDC